MGVGAVFVSTLATTRLPAASSPPENQEQLLASVLQPIVAFVVLGSICIRMLSTVARGYWLTLRRWIIHPFLHPQPQSWLSHGLTSEHVEHARPARLAFQHSQDGGTH
jgi:hypothetical protein